MSQTNIDIVQSAYAAFGRGDVPGILALLTPNVTWETVGRPADFPTFGKWPGIAGVTQFFTKVVENEDMSVFEPQTFDATADKVFVAGHCKCTVKRSGVAIAYDWLHIFTIRDGKVVAFREFLDSAVMAAAYRA